MATSKHRTRTRGGNTWGTGEQQVARGSLTKKVRETLESSDGHLVKRITDHHGRRPQNERQEPRVQDDRYHGCLGGRVLRSQATTQKSRRGQIVATGRGEDRHPSFLPLGLVLVGGRVRLDGRTTGALIRALRRVPTTTTTWISPVAIGRDARTCSGQGQ